MSKKPAQEKPKVVVGRRLPEAVNARLRQDYQPIFNPDDRVYSTEVLLKLCEGADALLPCHTERLSAEVVAKLPKSVKIVANYSVGVDHCDLKALAQRGIVVTNTPDVLSDATAEIGLLLMLGAARRASEGERLIRSGQWLSWSPDFMVGTQVTGDKTLGVIGMGRVGLAFAKRAVKGFDMVLHYHNRRPSEAAAALGATYHEKLDTLLGAADFLSLNCPATEETKGFFNAALIEKLKPGVVLINTARGALVDDAALIAALKAGKIAAAGLDVFNGEPDKIHPGYAKLDNVFLLPHIGSATRETRDAMGFRALANLDAFFSGAPPKDRVA